MIIKNNSPYSVNLSYPGIPLVFLHAFPLNRKMFEPQLHFCEQKGIGYLAFDYPGFGMCPPDGNFTVLTDYATYTLKLLEEMKIDRAVFVGVSMGGYLALQLLKDYPELCRGIILANSRVTGDSQVTRDRRRKVIENLQETGDIGPVIDSHLSLFFTEETRSGRPQLVTKLENLMRESTAQGIISAQTAMAGRDDFTEIVKSTGIPLLLLAASEDKIIPLPEYIALSKKLATAQLQIIENSGHISNLEQPEMFNRTVFEFVAELS